MLGGKGGSHRDGVNKSKRIHVVACFVFRNDDAFERVGLVVTKFSSATDQNGQASVIGRLSRRFKR